MPTNHSISSAMLRPSSRITHLRAAATSVNPCTGARGATSHGTSVAADLPGCRSAPGAQNTGIRGRLPAGQPGPASLQCRPANNRFKGYRDSSGRSERWVTRSGRRKDISAWSGPRLFNAAGSAELSPRCGLGRPRAWAALAARLHRSGGPAAASASDDAVLTQARDRGGVEAEPVGKHFFGVLAEQWSRFDFARNAVEAHRPGRHRHFAFAVRHRLEDAALPKAGFVDQFLRIEDGADRDADRAQLCHRLVLRSLAGPGGDDLVDLGLAFYTGIGSLVARIADEVLAPDQFQQARPMLGMPPGGLLAG